MRHLIACSCMLLVAPVLEAQRPARGYQSRNCGFDLDGDGIIGEASDDCNICDGTVVSGDVVAGTLDPDGDTTNEDFIYLDCDTGTNAAGCGTPGNPPCLTLAFALSEADGPGDGAEDIICLQGTCAADDENFPVEGVAGTYTVTATGSEAVNFQYPQDPFMIVGWDTDNDGAYPPADVDETAILDGGSGTRDIAFTMVDASNNGRDYIEIAHLTVQDYQCSTFGDDFAGFVDLRGPDATATGAGNYFYFHDLVLSSINQDCPAGSGNVGFSLFDGAPLRWLAIENINATNLGGYFMRGGGEPDPDAADPDVHCDGDGETRNIRLQNISVTFHSCDQGSCGGALGQGFAAFLKIWYCIDTVEVIDNYIDSNLGAWSPGVSGGFTGTVFGGPDQCTQNYTVRNNEMVDPKQGMGPQGYASGFCDGTTGVSGAQPCRRADNHLFDSNIIINTYEPWEFGDYPYYVADVDAATTPECSGTGDVTFVNNIAISTQGYETCFYYEGGHDNGAAHAEVLEFANNTCIFDENRFGHLFDSGANNRPHDTFRLYNNIFAGLTTGGRNIDWGDSGAPTTFSADNNVFDADGDYRWNASTHATLAAYQSDVAAEYTPDPEQNSVECAPTFVNESSDAHLQASDTCAIDAGTDVSSTIAEIANDVDNDSRPQGAEYDAGADEFTSGTIRVLPLTRSP